MTDSPSSDQSDETAGESGPAKASNNGGELRMLGEFRLLRQLGRGGMAEVYLAEQTSLKRRVAIKLLRPDMLQNETYLKRFQQEATAAAGLNHPNIVQVYVIGQEDSQHFIAMEYVQGSTLRSFVSKKGPPSAAVATHLMRQVASALETARAAGIVHRDIKPENIMITRKGDVKVADFGLSQLSQGGARMDLTQVGVTMGTPLYMSPEQVQGKPLDHRTDIYSFGVTCYHMLAGRPPFSGESAVAIAVQHLHEAPAPLDSLRPDLPPDLRGIVHKMMAKKADDRFQTAAEIVEALRSVARQLKDPKAPAGTFSTTSEIQRVRPEERAARRRSVLLITALALVTGSAAAGLGWWLRPGRLPPLPAHMELTVPKAESAQQQYVEAMFNPSEEAFEAVMQYWPTSLLEVRRAKEQLALLYLRDPNRWDDAERMLRDLEIDGTSNRQALAIARAGRAVLAAYRGEHRRSNTLLQTSVRPVRDALPRHWQEILERVAALNADELGQSQTGTSPVPGSEDPS